jgi:hypothetical protein
MRNEKINWSSGVGYVYIEWEEVKFVWCAHERLPGCVNKTAELPFPYMLRSIGCGQVFTVIVSVSLGF